MKKWNIFVFALLLAVLAGGIRQAEAHGVGPHGGKTVDMAPYDLEYVIASGMIHLYLIDDKEQTVAVTDVTGKLVVQTKDGTKKDLTLSVMGDALMAAGLDEKSAFIVIATLQIQGKTYTARISYDPASFL